MQNPLAEVAAGLYAKYDHALGLVDFTAAAQAVQKLAERANRYIEETEPFRWPRTPSELTSWRS